MSKGRGPGRLETLDLDAFRSLYAEVERAAGLGSYTWEFGGNAQWSEGMFRLLGVERGAPGDPLELFLGCVHHADRARVQAAWGQVKDTGQVPTITYRIVRPDGSTRWLRGSGTVVSTGGPGRIVGTLVDVTDSHEAAALLAETNELLSETQRAAGVGSHVYDLGTRRLEWSPELRRILGLGPDTAADAALSERMTHPDDRARQREWGLAVIEGKQRPPLQTRMVRPDGKVVHIESRARLSTSADGSVRMVGVTIDVSPRVEMEGQLRHAAKMEAVGTLAAGVAHDFNNYLTVINVQLDLLRSRIEPRFEPLLQVAQEAVEQSANLTRQLLAFARRQPWSPRRIELPPLVASVARLVARVVDSRVRVEVVPPPEPVEVDADPGQLEGVLMNLAINARDAMPDGGVLRFEAARLSEAEVEAVRDPGSAPGPYARIRVSDTGTGIAAEHLPRIFEPYFSTKAQGRGTGLGLASAYGAIRQHGGFIVVQSQPGSGTRFDVYVPLASGVGAAESRTPPPAPQSRTGRVLVVEDMAALRDAIAQMLTQSGHQVRTAPDGLAALQSLEQHPADVVLTDVMMPRMGGADLARRLRASYPAVGVILMTGFADEGDLGEGLASLGGTVLRKPFLPDQVVSAVAGVLNRRPG